MKFYKSAFLTAVLMASICGTSFAQGKISTDEDIANLKNALISGKVEVGITRMKDLIDMYGSPDNINDKEKTAVYDYGDMKIEFDKIRYMRKWEYDSFKKPAYTTEINDLRKDLESQKLPGDLLTYDKIKKDYKAPTESMVSEKDGELSVYYYGDIKLTFENNFVVKSWKGKKLEPTSLSSKGVLGAKKDADMMKEDKSKKMKK